jgi:hypothetical protein
MYDPEKSGSGIVATKPTNKAERSVAEPTEPTPRTKGNADQQSTHRAQRAQPRFTQCYLDCKGVSGAHQSLARPHNEVCRPLRLRRASQAADLDSPRERARPLDRRVRVKWMRAANIQQLRCAIRLM